MKCDESQFSLAERRQCVVGILARTAVVVGLAFALPSGHVAAQTYDLVLMGGRVMDPESGMDAVMNVGILNGSIAAISANRLEGREVVDVSGHVVAPFETCSAVT